MRNKKKAEITIIVSVAKNRVIGKGGTQPLYLKADLKRFKELTLNSVLIMGSRTYADILRKAGKPLPQRINIVLANEPGFEAPGCIVAESIPAAFKEAKKTGKRIFIIGGAQVFSQTMPLADRLEITEIQRDLDGDVFFPEIKKDEWVETKREKKSEGGIRFDFVSYKRKKGA